jgi:hypothetical protein
MSVTYLSGPKQVTTRKAHQCAWCGEIIPAGTAEIWSRSYVQWGDPPQSDWMHPECFEAKQSMDYRDLDQGWTPGDFERGRAES